MKKTILANNIYDILRATMLPDDKTKDTDWNELTRTHYIEAKKELKKYLKQKTISVSGDKITIGKNITITIN